MSSSLEPVERIHIGVVRKNVRELINVELRRMSDSRWRLALAMAFRETPDGPAKPGRGGISLPVDALPELSHVIDTALREARDRALVE